MLLSLHVKQDFLLFGFLIFCMGVRELFRGNFLIFTIAKNAKFITKYAHVNLSLMMSPPVDPQSKRKEICEN